MLMEIFSAIKHTLNGNLSKSLDVLIQEKTTEINAKVNAVKSTVDTINQNSGSLNRVKVFKSNGTFVVPSGVEAIYVTATAAGGDGGGSSMNTSSGGGFYQCSGGGGASGECVNRYPIPVTSGQSIPITVGAGNTVIGAFLTLTKGGNGSTSSGVLGSGGIYGGTSGVINGVSGQNGRNQDSIPSIVKGGSGAFSLFGMYYFDLSRNYGITEALGGTAGGTSDTNGVNAIKFGAGGSGAGGAVSGQTRVGGKGAQGVVIIEW